MGQLLTKMGQILTPYVHSKNTLWPKLIVCMALLILLLPIISALEFDNIQTYSPETKTYKINNLFGIGETLAEIKLTSELNVIVPRGYQKVAEFELYNFKKDYVNAFKDMNFYQANDLSKEINRTFDYKYLSSKWEEQKVYETICEIKKINNTEYEDCKSEQVNTKNVLVPVWIKFSDINELPNEESVTIGIFTEVLEDDYVEWIPTFFGERLMEWASWKENLNVDIVSYYKLDESSGTNAEDVVSGLNLTCSNGVMNGTSGVIGNSADFTGGTYHCLDTGLATTSTSISIWLKSSVVGGVSQYIIDHRGVPDPSGHLMLWQNGANLEFLDGANGHNTIDGIADVFNNSWNNVVLTFTGTTLRYYLNGVNIGGNITISATSFDSGEVVVLGGISPAGGTASVAYAGLIDEIGVWDRILNQTEVTELYNDGNGLIYNFTGISVILNSPIENYKSFNQTIIFNCTAYDNIQIDNVSLILNGVINETNSSGLNNTNYIFTKILTDGIWNWSCQSIDNDNSTVTASSRNFYINKLFENSQTYPTTAVESSTKTYTANISYDSLNYGVITGILRLNGSNYIGTRTGTGNNAIFSTNVIMPSITTETNFTSYWTISLTNVYGTTDYNLTSNNVTVSIINFSLCDASNNVTFWNFTILNESNAAEINSTFEATFTVRQTGSTAENIFSFSDTTESNSTFDFCISPGTESYTIDTNIKLTKTGFVDKFYDYGSVVVTNATRKDNLYMMATGDSTSFIVHTTYTSGEDLTNAEVKVQRYYPGTNEWLTTEILTTNDDGEAVGHFLSEDADYRFHVYLDGVSLYNSSATKIVCATAPCTVTLIIPTSLLTGYETYENLVTTLTYNSATNVFTYTYSDTSGDFTNARLWVRRTSPTNATIISPCNTTKTTASGVITCDITGEVNGTYMAVGYITRDDEFVTEIIYGVYGHTFYDSIGVDGILWSFFIVIGVAMLGIVRPSLAIIFSIISLILVSLLGLVNVGVVSIVAVISIGIILLMRVGRE